MTWAELDWEVLDRLRETFLSGAAAAGPYWHTITDLECYDFTYGERIGWKWDAVLAELRGRQWAPPARATVLDWGCGSGKAGRRVLDFFGAEHFSRLLVHDHSALAVDYASHHARLAWPGLAVERATARFLQGDEPIGVLVLSHVLNELDAAARADLQQLVDRAETVLWVEPGTHEVSRALGAWRERNRASGLATVAPCTHGAACGILAAGNERHWCHFFADAPPGIHADSQWVKFGQRAGIDLRSLPYSFLVLDRRPFASPAGQARLIGTPRIYKGFAKLYGCDAAGVAELTLQKRDAPTLFKALKHGAGPAVYRWTHAAGRITQISPP